MILLWAPIAPAWPGGLDVMAMVLGILLLALVAMVVLYVALRRPPTP